MGKTGNGKFYRLSVVILTVSVKEIVEWVRSHFISSLRLAPSPESPRSAPCIPWTVIVLLESPTATNGHTDQVVKTRFQLQTAANKSLHYKSIFDCFRRIIAEEGYFVSPFIRLNEFILGTSFIYIEKPNYILEPSSYQTSQSTNQSQMMRFPSYWWPLS